MSSTAKTGPRIISIQPLLNSMRFPAIVVSLVLALAASSAQAVPVQAVGGMTIDGNNWDVPIGYNAELGVYGIGSWNSTTDNFSGFSYTGDDGTHVAISGSLDPDPAIGYGITVTDFGAPSVFGFFFSTPIVVGATPTSVKSSVSGGLTDFTGDGVSITPTAALLQIAAVGAPVTNMGVDIGPAVSGGPGSSGALYGYGPYSIPFQPGPAGPWTTLSITVGFSLSGNQDVASLTGFAEIVPVPEPSSLCMLGMGALGLLYFARRRRG
jgi:hypothetical protein